MAGLPAPPGPRLERSDGVTGPRIPAARIVFSAQDREAILRMMDQSLQDGFSLLARGDREFEDAFALRHNVRHAVATSSGTSALEIIFRTLAVEGREVVIPTNTFFATAAAVVHAGGIPRLADMSPERVALSPETLEAALTPGTAVVVLVHIGGFITPRSTPYDPSAIGGGSFWLKTPLMPMGPASRAEPLERSATRPRSPFTPPRS